MPSLKMYYKLQKKYILMAKIYNEPLSYQQLLK